MFVSYSASYDWLLLARLRHYHKSTYYDYKLTHAQTFVSGIHIGLHFISPPKRSNFAPTCYTGPLRSSVNETPIRYEM